jgi:hypothetical protein
MMRKVRFCSRDEKALVVAWDVQERMRFRHGAFQKETLDAYRYTYK